MVCDGVTNADERASLSVHHLQPTRQAFCFGLYSWPGDTLEQGIDGGWSETCSNEKILVDGHCSVYVLQFSPFYRE